MKKIVYILISFLFMSCSSADWDIIDEYIELEKGERLSKSDFSSYPLESKFKDENNLYKVYRRELVSSFYAYTVREGDKSHTAIRYLRSPMYFIFKNEKLYYWGYLWEIKQYNNKEFNLIAKKIDKFERKLRNDK